MLFAKCCIAEGVLALVNKGIQRIENGAFAAQGQLMQVKEGSTIAL